MRSYGQMCGLAKALDVVGDRWTLLIVRELFIQGPSRYTDLMHGLPGIATNLLADRLGDMEANGIVRREEAPPPVATTLFHLTERGRALEPIVRALGAWGAPYLRDAPKSDAFRAHWLFFPLTEYLTDGAPKSAPVEIEVRTGTPREAATVRVGNGVVEVRTGAPPSPGLVLKGEPRPIMRLLRGTIGVAEARAAGVQLEGDRKVLGRLRPRRAATRGDSKASA